MFKLLKEKMIGLIIPSNIINAIWLYFNFYIEPEINQELKKEKVTEVSLEGLITEFSSRDDNQREFQYNLYQVVYSVKTEDNNDLLFIKRYEMERDKENGYSPDYYINMQLDLCKAELMALFKKKAIVSL
ncbi:hypothetical protein J4434_01030 [Candidatus Woesearchaeota archaeon]|nr:hypothetical protein [Candidatus Woesearchaeota archaeon]